jgi:hypothetical protein
VPYIFGFAGDFDVAVWSVEGVLCHFFLRLELLRLDAKKKYTPF